MPKPATSISARERGAQIAPARGDVPRDVAGQHVERDVAAREDRLIEVPHVEPRTQFGLGARALRDDLGLSDLVATGLTRPGAIALDLAHRVAHRQSGRGDELAQRLFARPAHRMDPGIDHQPYRTPRQPHEIAEPPRRIAVIQAKLIGKLFGIERPALGIGVERQHRSDQRQLLRIFPLPDMPGNALVEYQIGDRDAVVDRGIAQIDPDLARDRSVERARPAIGGGCPRLLRERHPPDLEPGGHQRAERLRQARADRIDPALHIGDDLLPAGIVVREGDVGPTLQFGRALRHRPFGQPEALEDSVHPRLQLDELRTPERMDLRRAPPRRRSCAQPPAIPGRAMGARSQPSDVGCDRALRGELRDLPLERRDDGIAHDLCRTPGPVAGDRLRLARERPDQRTIDRRRLGQRTSHSSQRLVEQEAGRDQPLLACGAHPARLVIELFRHRRDPREIGLGVRRSAQRLIAVEQLRHVEPGADILDDGIGRVAPVSDRRDAVRQRHPVQRGLECALRHRDAGQRRLIDPVAR
ncbi:hypothetical protein C8J24_3413 [Sphingomonas aerolata]|uniref:Uncharacterized protein n=1 Tax=Sphingomonas aerolata TaxID=185951 RepID=A0A2T4YLK7_9SPHN|nr:hypothetical protein C8J24_3413 [Sphingomonas aerolata]